MNTAPALTLKVIDHQPGKLTSNLGSFQILWEEAGIQINGCWYKIGPKNHRVSLPHKSIVGPEGKPEHYPILMLPKELADNFKASLIASWMAYAKEKNLLFVKSKAHKKHKNKKWRANVRARIARDKPAPASMPQGFEKLRDAMQSREPAMHLAPKGKRIWNDGPRAKEARG